MHKTISIASYKGGVGKTTSTINIGASLTAQGYKVLVVDSDPQSHLTSWLGLIELADITLPHILLEMISEKPDSIDQIVKESILKTNNFDVLPCSKKMASVEAMMIMAEQREYLLKSILACVKADYDFILIDCPPALGILLTNALTASDSVIIPVEAYASALDGLPDILNNITQIKRNLNPRLHIEGMILTKYQSRTNLCNNIKDLVREHYGSNLHVYEHPINHAIKVAAMPGFQKSVFDYDPNGNAAMAYKSIAKEVSLCQNKT